MTANVIKNRPIHPIWDYPEAASAEYLVAAGDGDNGNRSGLNSGSMLLRPHMKTFEELLPVNVDDLRLRFPEQVRYSIGLTGQGGNRQGLIDRYCNSDGEGPGTRFDPM